MKIFIIGGSGSGKTYLANKLYSDSDMPEIKKLIEPYIDKVVRI